jgi:predicted ATPase
MWNGMPHGLALALIFAAILAQAEGKPAEVERLASEVIELSTRQNFAQWLAAGVILRGWARSALGNTSEGISCIEDGIRDYRAVGARRGVPYYLTLKAMALHLANRTPEALEAIKEADALAEKYEDYSARSHLHRLRGVFLAAMSADEAQIEAWLGEAIKIAKEQKSISLATRAEATYAEYRRQKASGSGGHGFRLPLW